MTTGDKPCPQGPGQHPRHHQAPALDNPLIDQPGRDPVKVIQQLELRQAEPEHQNKELDDARVDAIASENRRLENIFKTRNTILEYSYRCTLNQLLQKTLDEVEQLSGSTISFFHFVEEDQVTLSLQTWSTNTLNTMCTAMGKGLHYSIELAGVWTDCIVTREPVIHNDYATLTHRKGLPEGHALVCRELVVPILRNDLIVALIGVGNKPTGYDQTDILSISQVADLVWDLAERKRAEEYKQLTNEALTFLATYTDVGSKLDFFSELAQYLARSLDANFVCVDRLEGDGLTARTLAVWHNGVFEDNIEYALKDTPCGALAGKTVCCFPAQVTKLFPNDPVLQDLRAESYAGVTLWSHTGNPIGLIAVILDKPLMDQKHAVELLKLVGVRASSELERLNVETERKKAEQEIHSWNARFKKLSANVPGLIYQFTRRPDGSYCVPIASERMKDIFGCTPEEVVDDFSPVGRTIHPEDAPRIFEAIEQSAENLTDFVAEYRINLPGKETRWNYSRSTPERLPDGSVTWYGFSTDITERRQAEEELRANQELLRLMANNFPDGLIVLWDASYQFIFVEGMGLADLGFSRETLIGRHPSDLFPTEVCNILLPKIDDAFRGNKATFELTRGAHTMQETILPLRNNTGEIVAVMGVIIDITQRKKAETKIIELNETLEKRIAERTNQLETTNRELKFHLDEIEQFAYITSHDLQEPLNAIINYSRLIHDEYAGRLDDVGNKSVDFIHKAASHLRTLVTDLLMYSLLGKGSTRSVVACRDVVMEILAELNLRDEPGQPRVTVRDLPVINGYPSELKLLFRNLVENAIKFSKPGVPVEIEVSAGDLGTEWTFYVEDDGIGIQEEDRLKIFTIFKRMVKRDEFAGTGIGLAYCKKIVEMHGGKIWVKSTPGKGSTFIFTIPKNTDV